MALTEAQVEERVLKYARLAATYFPGYNMVRALSVGIAESQLDPHAIVMVKKYKVVDGIEVDDWDHESHGSHDVGLFMINTRWNHIDTRDQLRRLHDPLHNFQIACALYLDARGIRQAGQGWSQWVDSGWEPWNVWTMDDGIRVKRWMPVVHDILDEGGFI